MTTGTASTGIIASIAVVATTVPAAIATTAVTDGTIEQQQPGGGK